MTQLYLPRILVALVFATGVVEARISLYGPCSISNNHLDIDTKAFVTDCDSFGFCAANGTCLPRGCRRDEYVLQSLLDTSAPVPPLCPAGQFCPDDASACLPWVELGQPCELNRDDECRPPPGQEASGPAPQTAAPGAICLQSTCMWENVTLGGACLIETTTYLGFDPSGTAVNTSVTRDNCIDGQAYCDLTTVVCLELKAIRASCWEDRECSSYMCHTFMNGTTPTGACVEPPNSAVHISKAVYGVSASAVIVTTAMILWGLVRMHRQSQAREQAMLETYRQQQLKYRKTILSLHSLALREKENSASMSREGSSGTIRLVDGARKL